MFSEKRLLRNASNRKEEDMQREERGRKTETKRGMERSSTMCVCVATTVVVVRLSVCLFCFVCLIVWFGLVSSVGLLCWFVMLLFGCVCFCSCLFRFGLFVLFCCDLSIYFVCVVLFCFVLICFVCRGERWQGTKSSAWWWTAAHSARSRRGAPSSQAKTPLPSE